MWILQLITRLTDPKQEHHRKLQFTYWLQWQLHKQLQGAAEYAQKRRVVLKGDLPIGAPFTQIEDGMKGWGWEEGGG